MNYSDFIEQKNYILESSGFEVSTEELSPDLFDFQKDIVRWALAVSYTHLDVYKRQIS